ncbi:hypothetical protein A9Q99_27570 [Gammaproteobacteria bacterium 45_16_T64]|nr:hypothetical protein A9Q99_27570 [Gammaproteobacteria bacterium 45_16_T64]
MTNSTRPLRITAQITTEPLALDHDSVSVSETQSAFATLVEQLNRGETLRSSPKIACKACHYTITSPLCLYPIQGSAHHVFTNPSGMTFDLQTFDNTEGCIISGTLLKQFSWFPGYCWQYAYCKGCGEHLGWHYERTAREEGHGEQKHEIPRFYGLVTDHLVFIE